MTIELIIFSSICDMFLFGFCTEEMMNLKNSTDQFEGVGMGRIAVIQNSLLRQRQRVFITARHGAERKGKDWEKVRYGLKKRVRDAFLSTSILPFISIIHHHTII